MTWSIDCNYTLPSCPVLVVSKLRIRIRSTRHTREDGFGCGDDFCCDDFGGELEGTFYLGCQGHKHSKDCIKYLGIIFPETQELDAFLLGNRCLGLLRLGRRRGRPVSFDRGRRFGFSRPLASEHGHDSILPLRYRFDECGRFVPDLPHIWGYRVTF